MKTAFSRLDLELLRPGTARRIGGMVILAVGILLILAVAAHFIRTQQRIAAMEAGTNPVIDIATTKGGAAEIEETKAVREGIAHLALPWDTLFSALEKVPADTITLVSVEPDTQKNTVKIVAETPDVYAMLEYVRSLSGQAQLKDVLLGQYEVRLDDPNQPVRFTLTAAWGAGR